MHPKQLLLCLLVLLFAISCRRSNSALFDKEELIRKATTDIPCVKEFHTVFPQAIVRVYSNKLKKGTTKIQVEDVVYDRYELTLTIGIEVNPNTLAITSFDVPLIILTEVVSIVGNANGP